MRTNHLSGGRESARGHAEEEVRVATGHGCAGHLMKASSPCRGMRQGHPGGGKAAEPLRKHQAEEESRGSWLELNKSAKER